MAPTIFVFIGPVSTDMDADIILNLERQGYMPLVDKIHQNDYYWFKNNFKTEHRFYTIKNKMVYDYTVENMDEEMDIKPNIAVAFDVDTKMYSENWKLILQFLKYSLFGDDMKEADLDLVREFLPLPVKEKQEFVPPESASLPDYYSFETHFDEEKDTMIYQIIKPFTDLPYTTITREFSRVGHTPFFTSLFICQSWGICKEDIAFLHQVWKNLKMGGEFNLDLLLKERTEKCYPSSGQAPEPEPVVYRRSLLQVLQLLEKRKNGVLV